MLLENVKGLKMHDKGNTLKVILATLDELNYGYKVEVLNAKYFGVPQNRPRIYLVGFDKKRYGNSTSFFLEWNIKSKDEIK